VARLRDDLGGQLLGGLARRLMLQRLRAELLRSCFEVGTSRPGVVLFLDRPVVRFLEAGSCLLQGAELALGSLACGLLARVDLEPGCVDELALALDVGQCFVQAELGCFTRLSVQRRAFDRFRTRFALSAGLVDRRAFGGLGERGCFLLLLQ
jgi:hypothetical protein